MAKPPTQRAAAEILAEWMRITKPAGNLKAKASTTATGADTAQAPDQASMKAVRRGSDAPIMKFTVPAAQEETTAAYTTTHGTTRPAPATMRAIWKAAGAKA